MSYKLDLHVHSKNVSRCSGASPLEIAKRYSDAGYSGIVSTNHFSIDTFGPMRDLPWSDCAEHFIRGYHEVREACEAVGLTALFGMELRFYESSNDYLVYGVTEELIRSGSTLMEMNPASFHKFAQGNDLLFYQAHPFRFGITIKNPADLDGIEVNNGHKGHNSNNDIAQLWADKYGLRNISGSDFHQPDDIISAGIATDERVTSNETLLRVLREGKYTIIRD